MAWPPDVKESALVQCQRSCCICHQFCGGKLELHHIRAESNGGLSNLDNCIPLCFNCHADVGHYNDGHPRGSKYSEKELRKHRDTWFKKVSQSNTTRYEQSEIAIDKRIASEIHILMMRGGGYFLLKEQSLWEPHWGRQTASLYRLAETINQPDFEFFDARLESLRAAFATSLLRSCNKIASLTGPMKVASNRYNVLGEFEFMSLPQDQQENLSAEVDLADELNTETANLYDALFREIRRKLGLDLRFEVLPEKELTGRPGLTRKSRPGTENTQPRAAEG